MPLYRLRIESAMTVTHRRLTGHVLWTQKVPPLPPEIKSFVLRCKALGPNKLVDPVGYDPTISKVRTWHFFHLSYGSMRTGEESTGVDPERFAASFEFRIRGRSRPALPSMRSSRDVRCCPGSRDFGDLYAAVTSRPYMINW